MTKPAKARRIEILHHGVDTAFFKPAVRDAEFVARYKISPQDRIALFLGTTYSFSGLDAVLMRLKGMLSRYPHFKVAIVGAGDLDRKLREIVRDQGLEDRVILSDGMRPYAEVPRWISLADVAFNSFAINDITRDIIPIKNLQYLACAKPVVSAPLHDLMRLLPSEESGSLYCDIENRPDDFMEHLGRISHSDDERERLGQNGLQYILQHFSMNTRIDRLERLLSSAREEKLRN
jgi:glycosyltransferase involved in cell wall biosynthesis